MDPALPLCCIARPELVPNGGAVHLGKAGVKSGLFKGQTPQFLNTLMTLAANADAATRTLGGDNGPGGGLGGLIGGLLGGVFGGRHK